MGDDSTTATTAAGLSKLPLSLTFRKAQALYNDVENTSLGGADPKLQETVTQALALCEAALRQVSEEAIFSQNEQVDDMNTGDLRYLMLPFYRGELLRGRPAAARCAAARVARVPARLPRRLGTAAGALGRGASRLARRQRRSSTLLLPSSSM